jgi:hypothetical protein
MSNSTTPQPVTITVDDTRLVSGLLQAPKAARVCFVLAHGAGAGMSHPFVAAAANGLAERGIATLRYQFPFMEQGSKRPDPPKLAQATVRAAVGEASHLVPKLALVAGGKSFGGRMTSQAQAASPLPDVRGCSFSDSHFIPPAVCRTSATNTCARLQFRCCFCGERYQVQAAARSTVRHARKPHALQNADRSFHAPARTGRKEADVRAEALDALQPGSKP